MSVRIISGVFGGRILDTPKGHATHPMGDRERTAIFNSIRGHLPGARVLDVFAGSGALGLEALSLGAESAAFIEKDARAAETVRSNIKTLKLEAKTKLHQAPASKIIEKLELNSFDVVFADPPYQTPQLETVKSLANLIKPSGLLVLSLGKDRSAPEIDDLTLISDKTYAAAAIRVYQKSGIPKQKLL
jgi:16S rRNA (guanine966-N2)-methyltransferase